MKELHTSTALQFSLIVLAVSSKLLSRWLLSVLPCSHKIIAPTQHPSGKLIPLISTNKQHSGVLLNLGNFLCKNPRPSKKNKNILYHNSPGACLLLYVLFIFVWTGIRHSIRQTQLKFSTSQVGLFVVLNEIIDAIKSEVVCQVVFHSVPITWRTDTAVLDSTWPPEDVKRGIRKRKVFNSFYSFKCFLKHSWSTMW